MGSSDPVTSGFNTALVIISVLAALLIFAGSVIFFNSQQTILTVFGFTIALIGIIISIGVMFVLLKT